MFVYVFFITHECGEVTISQVYAKDRISAMVHLELILGCDEIEMDYMGVEETTQPLQYCDTDNTFIKSN